MKSTPRRTARGATMLACCLAFAASIAAQETVVESLFDGKTLNGWRGDPKIWSVRDGAIVGSTAEHRVSANTFLIWQGKPVADFELTFQGRIEGNNSGVQYRSQVFDLAKFSVGGYQLDMHPNPNYVGMLYFEKGRGILAQRGQKIRFGVAGKRVQTGVVGDDAQIDTAKWHEYRIVAKGSRLIHEIDGVVTVDVTDEHPQSARSGVLALQVHTGPVMEVEFKDFALTRLGSNDTATVPNWIWGESPQADDRIAARTTFELDGKIARAQLAITCDNLCTVFVNGRELLSDDKWTQVVVVDVTTRLRSGKNVIAVRAENLGGPAALIAQLAVKMEDGSEHRIVTDATWRVWSGAKPGFEQVEFDDSSWQSARVLGRVGSPQLPWSTKVPTLEVAKPTTPADVTPPKGSGRK